MATVPTPTRTATVGAPAPAPDPMVVATSDPQADTALRAAIEHHNAGRLAEARALYEAVLARLPDNPDALHLMGLLSFAEGRSDQGVTLLTRAIDQQPGFMTAVANLGQMLTRLNRPAEAMATFRRAVDMAPGSGVAQRDLGYALLEQRDPAGAVDHFHRAIALDPGDFVAHVGMGLAMFRLQRLPEAAASLRHAVGLRPAQSEIHLNLGVVLRMQGRRDEAIGSFRVALLLRPDYPEALLNLGLVLLEHGRLDEALDSLRRAATAMPNRGEVHFALGQALRGQAERDGGDTAAAIASLRRAVELAADPTEPGNVLSAMLRGGGRWDDMVALERLMVARRPAQALDRVRLARALARVGQLDEAIGACQRALALDPGALAAVSVLGAIRMAQGDYAEARSAFEAVLAADPTEPAARTSLATLALAEGDFAAGWDGFEARFDLPELAAYRIASKLPDDVGALAGRRVLLTAEQGQGDTLHFVRYAALLAARGATVLLEVQAPLVDLLAAMPEVAGVTAQGTPQPEFDFACPMMSLPRLFGTNLDSIPATVPYLAAPAERVAQWRGRLVASGRRRVGLCWSGNAGYSADLFRSIPLAMLEPLLADPALHLHLVQTDIRAGDDAVVAAHPGVVDLRRELGDFADTAAVLGELDLVITVDTAVGHLAGALGRPVWIMLPYAADWRWLFGRGDSPRADSPWYPTARLFRQPRFGDWEAVLAEVQAALRAG